MITEGPYTLNWVPAVLPWTTGRYYSSSFFNGNTTAAAVASTAYFTPFYVPNPTGVTVTAIGMEHTTTNSALPRLGIYTMNCKDKNFWATPDELVIDAGTIDVSTGSGFKSATISQFLRQGWYYAASFHGAAVTYRAWNQGFGDWMGFAGTSQTTTRGLHYSLVPDDIVKWRNSGLPPRMTHPTTTSGLVAPASTSAHPRILMLV